MADVLFTLIAYDDGKTRIIDACIPVHIIAQGLRDVAENMDAGHRTMRLVQAKGEYALPVLDEITDYQLLGARDLRTDQTFPVLSHPACEWLAPLDPVADLRHAVVRALGHHHQHGRGTDA